jgi:hypothetical protein
MLPPKNKTLTGITSQGSEEVQPGPEQKSNCIIRVQLDFHITAQGPRHFGANSSATVQLCSIPKSNCGNMSAVRL